MQRKEDEKGRETKGRNSGGSTGEQIFSLSDAECDDKILNKKYLKVELLLNDQILP